MIRFLLPGINRRQAVLGLSLSSLAATAKASPLAATPMPSPVPSLLPADKLCILTPQAVEGPYYIDPKLQRADITEGKEGVPLRLRLQVVEAGNCAPLPGARVDVWHADALGHYSGYERQGDGEDVSTLGQTFLRGSQLTDAAGQVLFSTVYPGWYRGRTTHIHLKVLLDERSLLTGQLYFPDALSEYIYRNVAPYSRREERDTVNATDGIARMGDPSHASFLNIKEAADHYLASLVIGVDRSGLAVSEPRMPPFPGAPPFGRPPFGGPPGGPPPRNPERTGPLVPGTASRG